MILPGVRVLWVLLSISLSTVYAFRDARFFLRRCLISRLQFTRGEESSGAREGARERDWWLGDDDDEVIFISDESKPCMQGGDLNLFDQLPNRPSWFGSLGDDKSTIAMQTLREVSESYLFSLSFLGDYVVQLGVRPPVDVDAKIGDFLTSEQAYSLLEALTSLDPFESNIEYDSMAADELARELQMSVDDFCFLCDAERLNLPYGMDTVLHQSVVEKIREVAEYDEYRHLEHQVSDFDQ